MNTVREVIDVISLRRGGQRLQRTGGLITSPALLLLVPATMRLLGRANWWAPRPLRRLYARYGISDEIHGPTPVPAGVEG